MNAPDKIHRAAIELLYFDPKWFVFEMLPLEFFQQQVEKYQKSQQFRDDSTCEENLDPQVEPEVDLFWACSEHHRYAAFRMILSTHETISDAKLEQYIELCQLDADQIMGCWAMNDLLSWPSLTKEQREKLTHHHAFSNSVAQKLIWRNRMSIELLLDTISDDVFSEIVARQDSVFERVLVEAASISRPQLEVVAEKGISRAVRNIAKSKLGRRK